MFRVVENVRRQHLDWFRFVLETKGWDVAELARRTGKHASTFSKFLNDPENKAQLGSLTIRLIEDASGLKPFDTVLPAKPRGIEENEADRYEAERISVLNDVLKAMRNDRNEIDAWVLHSRCLEAVGYLPGDVLLVDVSAKPQPGDVVCAEVYDRNGRSELVFRIFEDPFLVSATLKVSLIKPLLIDNDRVIVRGVVVASYRERRAA